MDNLRCLNQTRVQSSKTNCYELLHTKVSHEFWSNYYHPFLGSKMRNHRVLDEYLLNKANVSNLLECIPFYEVWYNSTLHVNSTPSPFKILFCKFPLVASYTILNK